MTDNAPTIECSCDRCMDISEFRVLVMERSINTRFASAECGNLGCSRKIVRCLANGCTYTNSSKDRYLRRRAMIRHISIFHKDSEELEGNNLNNEAHYTSETRIPMPDDFLDAEADYFTTDSNLPLCDNGSMKTESDYSSSDEVSMESDDDSTELIIPEFSTDESQKFFAQDIDLQINNNIKHGGFRGLCWRAKNRNDLFTEEDVSTLSDSKLMLYFTLLLDLTPKSVNKIIYRCFDEVIKRTGFCFMETGVAVPVNKQTADSVFLGGKFGIMSNLPCPKTYNVGGHACMKIEDIIAHHLAQGRSIEFTVTPSQRRRKGRGRRYHHMHGCKAMHAIIKVIDELNGGNDDYYIGYFTTWSDSFLRSYVKQKFNNVWMYTITLPNPDGNSLSPYHTYCIAVGQGKLDHTCVIDFYAQEVESLMLGRKYYCATREKVIEAKFGCLASLADRPEKAFILKTALLGTYGKIASWAAEIHTDILPDCKKCFDRRLKEVLKDRHSRVVMSTCSRCCQWDLESESACLTKIPPPDKYPTESSPGAPSPPIGRTVNERYLKPIKQSFRFLVAATSFAAYNVASGLWNKGVMDTYLRTCAVAKSVRQHIWNEKNTRGTTVSMDENDDDDEISDGFHPITGYMSLAPILWFSKMVMSSYVDCGLHLVFHGVVAYCMEIMESFLSDHGLNPSFLVLVNDHLSDIEALRLEWIKMKCLPKRQWLGENELGFARIMPFIYGMFFENIEFPRNSTTSQRTIESVKQMFHSLHVLVSILMSPRDPESAEIENHVKLFLSACDRFCRSYWGTSKIPFWAKTGNFPTLLGLASQRMWHGPMRWYWEGTGERFIQKLKEVLVSMRKNQQYFDRKLQVMYRRNVFTWFRHQIFEDEDDYDENKVDDKPRMYYQYKTIDEIKDQIRRGRVLSGFTTQQTGDLIMIAYGNKRRSGRINAIGVNRMDVGMGQKLLGLSYVKCKLDFSNTHFLDENLIEFEECMADYCLMLPLYRRGTFQNHYSFVFSDWDTGDVRFKKSLPSICEECFSTNVLA